MSAQAPWPPPGTAIRDLLTPEASPENVRPYAATARKRAAWHRAEADHLDALADALYRWIAQEGGTP